MPAAVTPPTDLRPIVNRLKRAQGQLAGVVKMIEEGRDLESVVQQIKAVSGALERAGFAVVAAHLRRSLAEGAELDEELLAEVERLFLSLS